MKNSDKKYTKLHAIFFQTPLPPKKIIKKEKKNHLLSTRRSRQEDDLQPFVMLRAIERGVGCRIRDSGFGPKDAGA